MMSDKKLYVITSVVTGADGQPFALCRRHFDSWPAKDRAVWRVIGGCTNEPCNRCRRRKKNEVKK